MNFLKRAVGSSCRPSEICDQDFVGKQFGGLTVLKRSGNIWKQKAWLCKCFCGKMKRIPTRSLLKKRTFSCEVIPNCGCFCANGKWLKGQRFGKLTVEKLLPDKHYKNNVWLCKCDCGASKAMDTHQLCTQGLTSCGCDYYPSGPGSPCWKGCGDIPKNFWNKLLESARRRDVEVDVSIQDVWELFLEQNGRCALSGEYLTFGVAPAYRNNKNHVEATASLDRIDSSRGYVPGNIQWVHKWINLMKLDLSDCEFIDWCKRVVEFNN